MSQCAYTLSVHGFHYFHIAAPDLDKFAHGAHALTKESTASSGGEPILSTNVYGKLSVCVMRILGTCA